MGLEGKVRPGGLETEESSPQQPLACLRPRGMLYLPSGFDHVNQCAIDSLGKVTQVSFCTVRGWPQEGLSPFSLAMSGACCAERTILGIVASSTLVLTRCQSHASAQT